MATVIRNPLTNRAHSHQLTRSPPAHHNGHRAGSTKRSRSPDPSTTQSVKRAKAIELAANAPSREDARKDKERRRNERDSEFKLKYTRAFPSWVFYFDMDSLHPDEISLREQLAASVTFLGARVEEFFSKDVTHLVSLRAEEPFANKENNLSKTHDRSAALLRSPIKLKNRGAKDAVSAGADHLIQKAISFDMKVWHPIKLQSVLERCEALPLPSSTSHKVPSTIQHLSAAETGRERSLTRLLESERIHGTLEQEVSSAKRSDYVYFSRSSYFVLVEDMHQKLATIAAMEYPVQKGRDGKEHGTWPVLYCDPRARNPFYEYNEKEERRRERADKAVEERVRDRERRRTKWLEIERQRRAEQRILTRQGDLRRSVSMVNLHRRTSLPEGMQGGFIDLDAEFGDGDGDAPESVNASGFLASGAYMAASGNSVSVTSNVGTTSTAGHNFRLPMVSASLARRLRSQVTTSRKISTTSAGHKENAMGPPPSIPDRAHLRKSRSTNTLRLPKREEGVKPGYCESCRMKFEDFHDHANSRRHRKYAMDDSNFIQLDHVLSRVRRRTKQEVSAERAGWDALQQLETPRERSAGRRSSGAGDDIRWEEWVDHDEYGS
ncbi:hypothetical protein K474DRAFT_1655724 [Panus rudis PR-1116 ss-1]|nr:hypothetical protein K474DRAFT_1655724 [Panus rudis PR-1116 ss-1]